MTTRVGQGDLDLTLTVSATKRNLSVTVNCFLSY